MTSLWITLGAALTLISALDASPAKDEKNTTSGHVKNVHRAVTGERPFALPHPYHPSGCPPCDNQSCPNVDFTEIINNIQSIRNDVTIIKQNVRQVENINNLVVDMKEEVNNQNRETNVQIQQTLSAMKRSGGCSGGGNISQLTDSIMDELRDVLNEFMHPSGDSPDSETYYTILQTEKKNSQILKEILSIVTSGGIPCKDSALANNPRRRPRIDVSSQISIDDLSDIVRKQTEEVAVIVDRRDGELKEEVSSLIDILRKDIAEMTDKILDRLENVVGNHDGQAGDMDVIKESISSSTKSMAESAVDKAMSMFKRHMKGKRSLCD